MTYLFLFCTLIVLFVYLLQHPFWNRLISKYNAPTPPTLQQRRALDEYLNKVLPFYKGLSSKGKEKFVYRLAHFRDKHLFVGRHGLTVTPEMEILIAAGAIELTFGLNDYLFRQHKVIEIFPSIFYNPIIKAKLKGGTTKSKIMLSWNDTQKGFADADDKINLVLHEFAHALKISATEQTEFLENFGVYLDKWKQIAEKERAKLKRSDNHFLRKYAEVNPHEFFAVSVEHFFEAPEEFNRQMPDVYNHLSMLLHLDLLKPQEDYQLAFQHKKNLNRVKEKKRIVSEKEFNKGWRYFYITLTCGIMVGIPISSVAYSSFYISLSSFMLTFIVIGVMGLIINYGLLLKNKVVSPVSYVAFNFVGFAPFFGAIFYLLNFISYENLKTDYIPIESSKLYKHTAIIKLKENPYPDIDMPKYVKLYGHKEAPTELAVVWEVGIMGIPSLYDYYGVFPDIVEESKH